MLKTNDCTKPIAILRAMQGPGRYIPTKLTKDIDLNSRLKPSQIGWTYTERDAFTDEQISESTLRHTNSSIAILVDEGDYIPRYWGHRPPRRMEKESYTPLSPTKTGGIQAYPISGHHTEISAIGGLFKRGTNQKIIWLSPPAKLDDPYIVDATKLNLFNVRMEGSGMVHGGDIPREAIIKRPSKEKDD